jgi:hypothetical protein
MSTFSRYSRPDPLVYVYSCNAVDEENKSA